MSAKGPSALPNMRRPERQTNFKVVVRVRPPLPRELQGDVPFHNVVAVDVREQMITVSENLEAVLDEYGQLAGNAGPYNTSSFTFDHVYDQNSSQREVYESTARAVVDSALQGYNATIFAYGQTGTGKTFTMEGFNREGNVEARGIIPRAIEQIFGHIQRHASPRMRFLVRASYLQIYNEAISDLLKPDRNYLHIREDKRRGVYVEGLSEWVVRSPAEIYGLMERGGAARSTGETKMNEASSRSHAVFIVIAEQSETTYVDESGAEMTPEEFQKFMHARGVRREQEMGRLEDHVKQSFKIGKLNLVDLAGSERVRLSGATGQRLEESKKINQSLAALGNVISALTDTRGRQHIPYRDSKLTRMLEDSLGGNCRTTMMAMISPALEAMIETISTLKFANRAKNIKNEARVNEDLDQKSLLRKYERELKQLRSELDERNRNVVDKRRLLELDEQRRRAEADKMAAIRALEARSLEFMQEKEEKKRLEQRISTLMNQMIRGDSKSLGEESVPGNLRDREERSEEIMKVQQDKLRDEYEGKLADLERERESIEEEKAQVDRYKQLLLKQRDIMIALTQRLVERDEQIMALQDELDAYDKHHKDLEEKLDEKTAMLIRFQRISMEASAKSPFASEALNTATEVGGKASEMGLKPNGHSNAELVNELHEIISNQRNEIAIMSEELASQRPTGKQLDKTMSSAVSSSASKEDPSTLDAKFVLEERDRLELRVRQLESIIAHQGDPNAASSAAQQSLQTRCELLVKEREAVHTIMEQKIKVLVQGVSGGLSTVLQTAPQGGGAAGSALAKDVAALQRLVNASIAALRNAAAATSMTLAPQQAPGPSEAKATGNGSGNGSGNGRVAMATATAEASATRAASASAGRSQLMSQASSSTSAVRQSGERHAQVAQAAQAGPQSQRRLTPTRAAPPPPLPPPSQGSQAHNHQYKY